MKTKERIRLIPYFKWFDMWIGVFVDVQKRAVYVQALPMFGVKIVSETVAVCPDCGSPAQKEAHDTGDG